jgi:CO/xanthine dehydrogenase FAD-binding subunit
MIELVDVLRPGKLGALEKALAKLGKSGKPAIILAGGTDLLVYAKDGKIPPAVWIDITGIESLKKIEEKKGELRLGAMITWKAGDESSEVRRHASALTDSCRVFASPPIRGLGTFAGNIANASTAGDSLPPLYALDAEVELSRDGEVRRLPIDQVILGVRKSALKKREVITEIRIPIVPAQRSVFLKLGPRQALAISKLSVAVAATIENGRARDVRIALGAVAPTVVRARSAEALLEGTTLADLEIRQAAELAKEAASPIDDVRSTAAYRRAMVSVGVRRALERLRRGEVGGDLVESAAPRSSGDGAAARLPLVDAE